MFLFAGEWNRSDAEEILEEMAKATQVRQRLEEIDILRDRDAQDITDEEAWTMIESFLHQADAVPCTPPCNACSQTLWAH
eukprot:4262376-Karenia_brevis.AAC.1